MKKNRKSDFFLCTLSLICILFFFRSNSHAADVSPASDNDAWHPDLVSSVKFTSVTNAELVGFAIDTMGYVWTWGYNGSGRTGIGRTDGYLGGMTRIPFFVDNDIKVKEIQTSYENAYAITEDGDLYAWGPGTYGTLGNNTSSFSSIPVKVMIPEKVVMVDAGDATETAAVFAVGESGKVYAWGYGLRYQIPGYVVGSLKIPTEIPVLTNLSINEEGIKEIKAGYSHVLLLTGKGNVYSWGDSSLGALGNGGAASLQPNRITYFPEGSVKGIDARSYHSMVLTNDGKLYEFGYIYGQGHLEGTQINTPKEVQFDYTSANYIPEIVSFRAATYNGYIIDQHGRLWIWGKNNYYQFMTEGPLTGTKASGEYDFKDKNKGKLNKYLSKATQIPRTMGDGDTQTNQNNIKAPVFSGVTKSNYFLDNQYGYKYQGGWGVIDGGYPRKHPTIYDKKYYKTIGTPLAFSSNNGEYVYVKNRDKAHEQVYLVDKDGNKLVYVVRADSATTLSGNYYIASPDYQGGWYYENKTSSVLPNGVTEKTSVPEVKDSEKGWIELATGGQANDFTGNQLVEIPYITDIDTYESAITLLDVSGNLYRQSLNGSGNVAWGWDYDPIYDSNSNVFLNSTTHGIYDSYVYEVMFMRGAPRAVPGNIEISAEKEKHYTSDDEDETVKMKIGLGTAYKDDQLNITIEPKLEEVKYIVLPNSKEDSNVANKNPTKEDFENAYTNASLLDYEVVDLAEANNWKGITQKLGEEEIELLDDSLRISDNCVVWLMIKTSSYGAEPTVIKTLDFDNFYTDISIRSQGALLGDPDYIIFDPLEDEIVKETNDNIPQKIGFPLDRDGNIILNPTYGYDEVSVSRISDDRLDELGQIPKFSHHYLWVPSQATKKNYILNGVDNIKNTPTDIAETSGELPVSTEFYHKFYYEENPDIFFNLHYIAVDVNGDQLPKEEFDESMETLVLKEVSLTRRAPELLKDEKLKPLEYKIIYSTPENTVDILGFEELPLNKEVEFTVPYEKEIKDVTIYYLYSRGERDVDLNIRQVILNSNQEIELPSIGYVSYQMAQNNWQVIQGNNQVKIPSRKEETKDKYEKIQLFVHNDMERLVLDPIIPQYYEYVGYKISNDSGDYDVANIKDNRPIKVDYSDKSTEKWLTLYLKPTTDISENHSWEIMVNKFGKILMK